MSIAERAVESLESQAETIWLDDQVIQTKWRGLVNGALMHRALADMEILLQSRQARYWYCDTSQVTNYSVDIRKPATELMSLVKARGCQEVVSIVKSAPIRMLSMSLSFVVGIRVKVVASTQEAQDYLKNLQRE